MSASFLPFARRAQAMRIDAWKEALDFARQRGNALRLAELFTEVSAAGELHYFTPDEFRLPRARTQSTRVGARASSTGARAPTPPPPKSKGPAPMFDLTLARVCNLALTLAQRSPAAVRTRAARSIASKIGDSKTPTLDECVELLRAVADDEDAPKEDREKARRVLKAFDDDEKDDDEKDDDARKARAPKLSAQQAKYFDRTNPFLRRESIADRARANVERIERELGLRQ